MSILAEIYYYQGHYVESEEVGVQVFDAMERLWGICHPDTIWVISDLASPYYCQGAYVERERYDLEVLKERKGRLGLISGAQYLLEI